VPLTSGAFAVASDNEGHYGAGSFDTSIGADPTLRYEWPSELDLMAQLAGLRLRERWDGWPREVFTSESRQHVPVWEGPANRPANRALSCVQD